MIKAIFFDIDGTLVSFQSHQVPESTVECIHQLREKGIMLFIATGRRLQSINNLGTLQFDGYITLNGGYCLAGSDRVVYKQAIPAADIEALLQYHERVGEFPCAMAQEQGIYMNYVDDAVREVFELLHFPAPPMRPLREVANREVFQLIAFFTKENEEEIMAVLPGCEATRWNPLFSDVVCKGVNKRIGIDQMLAHYGIDKEECMAFGDGGNDIEMLRHVGIGVAMGNADEEVKQAADYVTSAVDDDGIATALKHFGIL